MGSHKLDIAPTRGSKSDIAGKDYWDCVWIGRNLPMQIDPRNNSLKNYMNIRFHLLFKKIFGDNRGGQKILEIGCAGSAWLPYFAAEYGFEVTGIDYTELGCQQAKEILKNAGLNGSVHCRNMFDIPDSMRKAFDVVVTFGVVEHFDDTISCMKTLSEYCKPEGMIITIIPNLAGITGFLQKQINMDVYSVHKILSAKDLDRYSHEAGLNTISMENFLFFNLGVIDPGFSRPRTLREHLKRFTCKMFNAVTLAIWFVDRKIGPFEGNELTSSHIIMVSTCNN